MSKKYLAINYKAPCYVDRAYSERLADRIEYLYTRRLSVGNRSQIAALERELDAFTVLILESLGIFSDDYLLLLGDAEPLTAYEKHKQEWERLGRS